MAEPVFAEFRLLIADDDPIFRETVLEIIEPYFPTIAVESGEQAIEVVESAPIDLALFDMHMHVVTGLDVIRWMREQAVMMPCILMSSEVTGELTGRAMELETFSVIRKPPGREDLLDTIQLALKL